MTIAKTSLLVGGFLRLLVSGSATIATSDCGVPSILDNARELRDYYNHSGIVDLVSYGGAAPTQRNLAPNNSNSISFAGIVDFSNMDWAETIFEVTVDLLNERGNGFFDEELSGLDRNFSFHLLDSACDGFTALQAYWKVRDSTDAVIGCRCSGASIPVAWASGLDGVPQISAMSTSAKLSDKTEFPYFSRIVAPDDVTGMTGALVNAMKVFDWDRVTIINTDVPYAKDHATDFQGAWRGEVAYSATIKLADDGTIDETSARKVLREAPHDQPRINSKVVLLFAHNQHAYPILKLAKEYFPSETFWVGPEAWAGIQPTSTEWLPEFPGYIGLVPYRDYRHRDGVLSEFFRLGGDRLKGILDDEGNLPEYAAEYTIDAIIAMALAYAKALSLRDLEFVTASEISRQLRSLSFQGASRLVEFTAEGDRKNPYYTILNYQRKGSTYEWVEIGRASSIFGSVALYWKSVDVCFGGIGCELDAAPDGKPPLPPDPFTTWLPVAIVLLTSGFLSIFCFYRRKTRAILAAKEAELNNFRNSVVDMCTAQEQYVPSMADKSSSLYVPQQTKSHARWCWRETNGYMDRWDDDMIEGNINERWIRYDDASNTTLELAYQEQGKVGSCNLVTGYTVDFSTMIQTNNETKFVREVQRVEVATQEQPLDLSKIQVKRRPREIANEPQMVLVPGDIVQISKKRKDGWAYGLKLHLQDEPLGRRLVEMALASHNMASVAGFDGDDDGEMIIADKNGWFPTTVTRAPNTDDLGMLQKTLGGADTLAAPDNWDKIVDPSVVQKSSPLDTSSLEYQEVAKSFSSTLSSKHRIVSIQRIQNLAMWQSYVVKRKTTIDRDKPSMSGAAKARERFERRWLWHGTTAASIEKIIQQGFNKAFCGKNATMYGKGVYFARDASYSACDTYSPKDAAGRKCILACSVVVGEFCRGRKDARTPDLRDAARNILYDSTVDVVRNPSLYVTYHDAQAYPEYLIVFK